MTVFKLHFAPPPFSRKEILRYMGAPTETPEITALTQQCLAESEPLFRYDICYTVLPLKWQNGVAFAENLRLPGEAIARNLLGCHAVLIFAATVGTEIDRLIHRYGHISPAAALCYEAIGSERIESLCDAFLIDLKAKMSQDGVEIRPRFSPGYGDLPLTFQKELFVLLDPQKHIGLSLGAGGEMIPKKSVTALVGIRKKRRLT